MGLVQFSKPVEAVILIGKPLRQLQSHAKVRKTDLTIFSVDLLLLKALEKAQFLAWMAAKDLSLCEYLHYLVMVRKHLKHWFVLKPNDRFFSV